MADFVERTRLIELINEALSAANIQATLQKISPLPASADFLEISYRIGALDHIIIGSTLRAYRRELTMPALSRRIMTVTYRFALLNKPDPIPLTLDIRNGDNEGVDVTHTPAHISVVVTRRPPSRRRAP